VDFQSPLFVLLPKWERAKLSGPDTGLEQFSSGEWNKDVSGAKSDTSGQQRFLAKWLDRKGTGMTETKTIAIVQARMNTERFPGKILQPILDRPMLEWVIHRVGRARTIDEVIVATTTNVVDDPVEFWCHQNNIRWFRGPEHDVLDRYVQAATWCNADHIVRVGADCPLIDPELIDEVVSHFYVDPNCEWCSNFWPERHYPRGLDVECFSLEALRRVNEMADSPELREHVTLAIYRNPKEFRISSVCHAENLSYLRWLVDTQEDLDLVRTIAGWFRQDEFTWRQALDVCRRNWHWNRLNSDTQRRAA
jgi:spore coat polysaccharide biosynthesis protein SpsF